MFSRSVGSRVPAAGQCKNGHDRQVEGSEAWGGDGKGIEQGDEEAKAVPASRGLLVEFIWSSGPKLLIFSGWNGAHRKP